MAISEKMSSFNEELILKDIIRFLENRLQNRFDYDYKENLAKNMLKELIGYGEISSLIDDDNLEEIMVIGINKPVFVYHREYGMMETDLFFTVAEDDASLLLDDASNLPTFIKEGKLGIFCLVDDVVMAEKGLDTLLNDLGFAPSCAI